MQVKIGSTDQTVYFHLRASADGTSKTGLAYNSAGAIASYIRTRGTRTAIALVTLVAADSDHSDGGFIEVDGTNAKGLYRLDIPDAAFASGVDEVIIHIGFTDVFEESLAVELVDERPGNLKDDAITAAKIAADAIGASEFTQAAADKVWGTTARILTANTNLNDPTAAVISDAVWNELIADHVGAGSFGAKNQKGIPSETIGDYKATGFSTHTAADIWGVETRALTDKAGFALSAAAITAIWDKDISAYAGAGYAGTYLKTLYDDWLNGGRLDLLLDAIPTTAMRGTDNAALASVCTEARLVELAAPNLPTDIDAILADTGTDGVVIASGSKTGYALSAAGIDSILDEVVEGTLTFRQIQRIVLATLSGKSAGGGTATITFRDNADSKNRISATVDANGNRTAITLDGA